VNYLCDTSALVAHALHQPGADIVQSLLDDESLQLSISVLSLFELAVVLKQNAASDKIPLYWETYSSIFEVTPVDGPLARSAWTLRESAGARIPLVDAIIAATARARKATLVHRDQHLDQIPETTVAQLRLPSA